jgi:hypothetical protein
MKNGYLLILLIVFISILLFSVLNFYFVSPLLTCSPGKIIGKECTGPIAGSKYICYEPMEDAGKECNSASDCKGSCVLESLTGCGQTNDTFFLAICDSTVKGKCSPNKRYESVNNMLNYSDFEEYLPSFNDKGYSLTQENKIIVREEVGCV